MAVLQLSGFGERLSCCYSRLCPENMQATVIQQQEKGEPGISDARLVILLPIPSPLALGFQHINQLYGGECPVLTKFNSVFPGGLVLLYQVSFERSGTGRGWFVVGCIQTAALGAHGFTMTITVEEVFLASGPPCVVHVVPPWDGKSEATCALAFCKVNGKNGRGGSQKIQGVLDYKNYLT